MNVVKVSEGIKSYINTLVDDLAVNDFLIGAIRPMIRMAIENNFYKVNNILKVLALLKTIFIKLITFLKFLLIKTVI